VRLQLKSYATSVRVDRSQLNHGQGSAAPPYSELVQRLRLIGAGIDFLLGHPDLKSSEVILGVFELRQTALFGKETDQNTARQQASGVRCLNRGTGLHPKTLQRARRRLREAGFMRVLFEPGDRRGSTYSPDFEHILAAVAEMRTPEQIAPGYPGANCSPHQSYPSGSNSQSSARLAGSQPAPPEESRKPRAEPAQQDTPLRDSRAFSAALRKMKMVFVPHEAEERMQAHLKAITETYPRAKFGPANRTTAHDILAAATLADSRGIGDVASIDEAIRRLPDDVAAFLASKCRDKRPYPYENGIRTFGGMLKVVYEDFSVWFRSQQAPETPVAADAASPSSPSEPCETAMLPTPDMRFLHPAHPVSARAPVSQPNRAAPNTAGPCERCAGKGYRLHDTGTESVAGEELKTIAARACECPKGRQIGYRLLADIERQEAKRRGPGWIAEHRPCDQAANYAARSPAASFADGRLENGLERDGEGRVSLRRISLGSNPSWST